MKKKEGEVTKEVLLEQMILTRLQVSEEDIVLQQIILTLLQVSEEELEDEVDEEIDSVEEVVDNEEVDKIDEESFFQYGQELERLKIDYESLFEYLGNIRPVQVDYWNLSGDEAEEDKAEYISDTELLSNEVMDRIVTMEKMDTIMGTTTHMPIEVKERYQLLNKLIMYHALFQMKYALWG